MSEKTITVLLAKISPSVSLMMWGRRSSPRVYSTARQHTAAPSTKLPQPNRPNSTLCRLFQAESPSTKASRMSISPANRVPSPAGRRCSARFLREAVRFFVDFRFFVAMLLHSPCFS